MIRLRLSALIQLFFLQDIRRFGLATAALEADAVEGGTMAIAFAWVVFREYLFLLLAAAEDGLEGGAVRDVVSLESSTK